MKSPFAIFKESANSFSEQEAGEKVVLLLRRHPIVIILRLIVFAFLAAIPFIVGAAFYSFLNSHGFMLLFFFLASLWYLILWQAVFYAITMYALDVWIVTNHRIIDSTQHGFFNRTTSELHLSRVQDISVQVE